MGLCGQIITLLWKNWLLQKRRIYVSVLEVLIPCLFALIFVFLRSNLVATEAKNGTFYNYNSLYPVNISNTMFGYSPQTVATEQFMNNFVQLLSTPSTDNISLMGFRSEKEAIFYYKSHISNGTTKIIVFEGVSFMSTELPKKITLTIRPDSNNVDWKTHSSYDSKETISPRYYSSVYQEHGILYLQKVLGESLVQYWLSQSGTSPGNVKFNLYVKRLAYPNYDEDNLINVVAKSLPIYIILNFIISVIINTKNLIYEKEKGLKEAMNLLGLTSAAQMISWILTFAAYLVPTMALYTYVLFGSIVKGGPVVVHTDGSLFFVFLLCYAMSLIAFCFLIGACVQKANTGAVFSGIVFFASYLPYNYMYPSLNRMSKTSKLAACLLSNVAIGLGVKSIFIFELAGEGAKWTNFYYPGSIDDNVSVLDCMLMLVIDSVLYLFIAWYLGNIRPGEFGMPEPFFFCLTKTFWFPKPVEEAKDSKNEMPETKYFEKEPVHRKAGIRMCDLKKKFGNKVAVAGTTLNMYEGQITVLLGHNGAGKTTTMSMLTGFIPPTSGTAYVNGYNTRKNIANVRSSLGLCPQHNILFDSLTVLEHIKFYAKVKGFSGTNMISHANEMAEKVGLQFKMNVQSKNLSGGMKRKLCVAIALIGGAKVVIFDEPSAGLDPAARRHLWSVLKEAREGRTVLLTTHYMDEADMLGDRIAIMGEGVVKCCGTSMFLKKLYGSGYHLVIVKLPNCDINSLTKAIKSFIPAAELENVINTEVSYLLPDSDSSKFASLFTALDKNKNKLFITSFGTSATTMEEVFLKVGANANVEDIIASLKNSTLKISKHNRHNIVNEFSKEFVLHVLIEKKSDCDVYSLTSAIQSVIPTAHLANISITQATFSIPESESSKLPDLFKYLENNKEDLRIERFAEYSPNMEEFHKDQENTISDKDEKSETNSHMNDMSKPVNMNGVGHKVLIVKRPNCDVNNLTNAIQAIIPAAKSTNISTNKVTYILPDSESSQFQNLLKYLENNKEQLRIDSFRDSGLNIKALSIQDELKVDDSEVHVSNPDSKSNQVHADKLTATRITLEFNKGYIKMVGLPLEISRMRAVFVKKAVYTWRNRIVTIPQLLLPFTFALLTSISSDGSKDVLPSRTFNLEPFGRTYIPYTDGINATPESLTFERLYTTQFAHAHDVQYFRLNNTDKQFDNYTIEKANAMGIRAYNTRMIIGMEMIHNVKAGITNNIAYYNGQPLHAEPISVNYLVNTLVQSRLNDSFSLQTALYPLPKPLESSNIDSDSSNTMLTLVFGTSLMAALFIHFVIKERELGAKHMQTISGVRPVTYWLPTFVWDLITYSFAIFPVIVIFAVYDNAAVVHNGRWALVISVMILYAWATLPFAYAFQYLFTSPANGVVVCIIVNFITGMIAKIIVIMLRLPLMPTRKLGNKLNYVFLIIFPHYNFATCLLDIATNYDNNKLCDQLQKLCTSKTSNVCCKETCRDSCLPYESNYISLQEPGIGKPLVFLFLQGVFYFLIVMFIEFRIIYKIWYNINSDKADDKEMNASLNEDNDVAAERKRILSSKSSVLKSKDSLVLMKLYKRYNNFVAVDHICLGIPEKECFGLLGQNGAGKTTIFKMLTGDTIVTSGNAYLKRFDIKQNIKHVHANMGYCPQFDALIPEMTGRETLTMFARFRGIPQDSINRVVTTLAQMLTLDPYIDKMAGQYSGGTKRKLSTAVALIGNPPFIMLDEPSAGMDPEARRTLWNILSLVRASGATLVLTSHSMEECDALCTRIAIMVNGRFVCLGSPQHLKNKFGQGYTLIVQLGTLADGTTAPNQPVIDFILSNFSKAKVFQTDEGYVHFQVPDATIKLADIFLAMESTKQTLNVRDYSVHQTTLEQLFLAFTGVQTASRDVKPSWSSRLMFC